MSYFNRLLILAIFALSMAIAYFLGYLDARRLYKPKNSLKTSKNNPNPSSPSGDIK